MSMQPVAPSAPGGAAYQLAAPDPYAGRLSGPALGLLRAAWGVTALATLAAFLVALPAHFQHLLANSGPGALPQELHLVTLQTLGISNSGYAAYIFGLNLLLPICSLYVSNIFGKLQVADRAQAMLRARDAGLGTFPRS